jgi:hypothetical protein
MVSKLYSADKFYNMQKKGLIARPYTAKNEKLHKDKDGFFLYREKKNGDVYKQRVKNNDKIYTRQETGATKYSKSKDRDITGVRHKKQTSKEHEPYAHMYDRTAKSTKRKYKI